MQIKNDIGIINMGGFDDSKWRVIDIDGLGLLIPERNVVRFANQAGQRAISETLPARTITMSGELINNGDLQRTYTEAIRVLSDYVELKIVCGFFKKRLIRAKCISFTKEKPNKAFLPFVMQFICDVPLFEDFEKTSINVFERTNNLTKDSVLPCVFSTRTNKINVINKGDTICEPLFLIYSNLGTDNTSITIINNTTDQHIIFTHNVQKDENITVDIPNRRITSDLAGDITSTITDDTFLSNFWLGVGNNEISLVSENLGLFAICEFVNKYIEAVI